MDSGTDGQQIMKDNQTSPQVMVGVVIHRAGAYVMDKFLANQKAIQDINPSAKLVFATNEPDYALELEDILGRQAIRATVLRYQTVKPDFARSRIWNISCGRETIRRYFLREAPDGYLAFFDADMIYAPAAIDIMLKELEGYDAVFSGYRLRRVGVALCGGGCGLFPAATMREFPYRCLEFKNGVAINEDALLEFDLLRAGKRLKKGFFFSISHYDGSDKVNTLNPMPVGWYRRITHSKLVRYSLIQASIILKYDLGSRLITMIYKLTATRGEGESKSGLS